MRMPGTVLVVACAATVVGCGSQSTISASVPAASTEAPISTTTAAAKSSTYRFVKPPVVLRSRGDFLVIARLDRVLPRNVAASSSLLQLDDVSGVPQAISSSPHCYQALISGDQTYPSSSLRNVTAASKVSVSIRRRHVNLLTVKVTLKQIDVIGTAAAAPYVKKLGCKTS